MLCVDLIHSLAATATPGDHLGPQLLQRESPAAVHLLGDKLVLFRLSLAADLLLQLLNQLVLGRCPIGPLAYSSHGSAVHQGLLEPIAAVEEVHPHESQSPLVHLPSLG